MQRLRLSLWKAWGGASVLALASSCGLATEGADIFDIVDDVDASIGDLQDSGTGREAGAKDAGTDSGSDVDGATDASPDVDLVLDGGSDADLDAEADGGDGGGEGDLDAAPDASDGEDPLPDAGDPDVDPGPCVPGADPCDLDCDGSRALACGGDDCCDSDSNVHPGQSAFFTTKNACGDFDYNCDGVEQKQLGLGKACSRPFWDNSCSPHQEGFKDNVPACGQPGIKFVGCTARTVTGGCNSKEEAALQACR